MQKTNKSLQKRFKVTRKGKVMARKPGQDHFRAKKKRKCQLDKKRLVQFVIDKKTLGRYLPKN